MHHARATCAANIGLLHKPIPESRNTSKRIEHFHMTSPILVFQNNETAAIQDNPMGAELFSYENALFCSNKFA